MMTIAGFVIVSVVVLVVAVLAGWISPWVLVAGAAAVGCIAGVADA